MILDNIFNHYEKLVFAEVMRVQTAPRAAVVSASHWNG